MASTYLTYTPSSGVTLGTKATISFWVKRSKLDSSGNFYGILSSNGGWNDGTGFAIGWREDMLVWYNLANASGYRTYTNRKFRDTNAWYHIVYKIDTTQASMQDRITLYVNGVDEGDLTSNTSISNAMPSQNASLNQFFDSGDQHQIGRGGSAGSTYFDGSLSHFHYVDGSALAPTVFGSTDSTTGEWQINTSPSYTVGNNGFFILKDGNSVTDQSANSNNFTVGGGTLTFTHDNPSNVFATLNPLSGLNHAPMEHGNCSLSNSGTDGDRIYGTIPSKAGYYEFKIAYTPNGASGIGVQWGCFDITNFGERTYSISSARTMRTGYGYNTYYATTDFGAGNSWENVSTGLDVDTGDILMCAWKNGKVYMGYNGTWFFSANPSNNTDGSTQIPLADSNAYQMPVIKDDGGGSGDCQFNFGNGYLGTTAITTNSGNGYQDANGQGKFQYQPPTGCYALCTKNLNV